jgi:hypothetical protein
MTETGAVEGNCATNANHRDFLKALTSFGLAVSLTASTETQRPVISFAAGYLNHVGRVGSNGECGNVSTRNSERFGPRAQVRRFATTRTPGCMGWPGVRSAHSELNGLRSNRRPGAACKSYLRRESEAFAVNNAPRESKKTGQRNRIAVLTHVAGPPHLFYRDTRGCSRAPLRNRGLQQDNWREQPP